MLLFAELKQRKVLRVAATYAVIAWLLIQVSATVGPALNLPAWTSTFITVLLILGFPAAVVLAWTFDVVRTDKASSGEANGIAVLPFANLTGEADQGHLADGIVEDLLTRLHASDRIRVVSRQSSRSYKDRAADARTIARELGCRYVVEGSVRKLGDRVRVTAQLIDAPADRHLWAERYDRQLQDAFALQDEICDAVVAAIEARVVGEPAGTVPPAGGVPETPLRTRRALPGRWIIPALVALVGMAALLTWTLQQRGEERRAREDALPRLQALIAADDYAAAFDLAREIERVTPRDPVLRDLEPSFSAKVRLDTAPDGAKVFYRPYTSGEKDWRFIGETPLVDVAAPIGVGLWRIEKEGHDTALLALRNPGLQLGNSPEADLRQQVKGVDLTIPLADAASSPDGMVLVPAIPASVPGFGADPIEVPAFLIDRFEVRNRDFKEFVDGGGYAEADHWWDLPFEGGGDWRAAVAGFVDLTGRPGPATWRAGTYPDGAADHPVTGVSWYEAAAYCRFRGKELPTAYHWYRAAGSIVEYWESIASAIVHRSNFGGRELVPVGTVDSIGPHGTYDMAGNAREWVWTEGSLGRWIVGGAFNEPPYLYLQPDEAPPADRSAGNGFRCMRPTQSGPANEALRRPVVAEAVDYAAMVPVGDAAYAVLAQQLDYQATPFTPRVDKVSPSNPAWTVERITLPTGYDNTSFAVQLFLPADRSTRSGVIFYMPHAGEFIAPVTTKGFDPAGGGIPLDFLPKSGWALAVVAFDGAFERQWSAERRKSMGDAEWHRLRQRHWREDLGRTIDYLATREDIDARKFGWFGISMGADMMLPLLAVEKRIGAAVLYSGGSGIRNRLPASEQPYNYLPRVTQPVLMLSGRWDIDCPPDSQRRMLELLGSPADSKKYVLFEAGHGNLPRFQVEKETLDWFERHLGSAAR
jgi:TolB-like protein/pimeloyl-ACP methyl ester carboxylesterase